MRVIAIVFLLGLVFVSCGKREKGSEKYSNEVGRFKIGFPDVPKTSEESSDSENGKVTVFSFVAEPLKNNNLSYELKYVDYPTAFVDTLTREEVYFLFDGSQKALSGSPNFKLLGISNMQISGYQGREYQWQNIGAALFTRTRFFLVANRLYILSINTGKDNNFNVDINKYFNSFELLNTPPGPDSLAAEEDKLINTFHAEFPGPVERREFEKPTTYGTGKLVIYFFQPKPGSDSNVLYSVSIMKYSGDITKLEFFDLDAFYDQGIETALNATQATLISRHKVMMGQRAGVEYKFSNKDGQTISKQRSVLAGDVHYIVNVMTTAANDENAESKKFFDSFSLTID